MVDWVSGFITPRLCEEFGARFYDTGKLLKLGPGGEVVWEASGRPLGLSGASGYSWGLLGPPGASWGLLGPPVTPGGPFTPC